MSLQTIPVKGPVTCRLCRRKPSKYTCPTCNVPYCSLTCFRSQSHAQCSETFYKQEVESDIQSEPSRTTQERLKMMEMLKRFEGESVDNETANLDLEEEGDNGEELAKRFSKVDLEAASPSVLWSMLKPDEQAKFMKAINDPDNELTQQLLASEELENERREPWWEAPAIEEENADTRLDPHRTFGARPEIILVPSGMVTPLPTGPPLIYNMCAICIAYSYATRHLAMSPLSSITPKDVDFQECQRLISELVPFVTVRNSTTLYQDLSTLITDIWSRFRPGVMDSRLFSLLLRDTAHLTRPLAVTLFSQHRIHHDVISNIDPTSHPHAYAILVLSDLTEVFKLHPTLDKPIKPKSNHVAHKLLFYAAHILSTPSSILRVLSEEILRKSLEIQEEIDESTTEANILHERKNLDRNTIIEEL